MRKIAILLVILSAIVIEGCDKTRSEIRFTLYRDEASVSWPVILVHTVDGSVEKDFQLDGIDQTAGPFNTRQSGTMSISFIVMGDGGPSKTQGSIDISLKQDWSWSVNFHIATNDPAETCFGCAGSEAFDLDPDLLYDPEKSLFLVWGGNWISNPVIY
jgi:hypothetical protein